MTASSTPRRLLTVKRSLRRGHIDADTRTRMQMYSGRESLKPSLRNREDRIRILQAFSHSCVSVSGRYCFLCVSRAHVFLSVTSPTVNLPEDNLYEKKVWLPRGNGGYTWQIKRVRLSFPSIASGECDYSQRQTGCACLVRTDTTHWSMRDCWLEAVRSEVSATYHGRLHRRWFTQH